MTITLHRVREMLDYDPATGKIVWAVDKWALGDRGLHVCKKGHEAGLVNSNGYRVIKIDKTIYYGHRLAWLMSYGAWPNKMLDHINGVRHDNRLENLRQATHSENARNKGKAPINTSGHKGVVWHKRECRWHAYIRVNKKRIYLGSHSTKEEAATAYAQAAHKYHGEFARL